MRSLPLFVLIASSAVDASWFSSDDSNSDIKDYTSEQYSNAQKIFSNKKDDVIKDWDDSKLRKFLVDQGVVDPSGPRESLEALAKSQYASYTSFASVASKSASSILYGDKTQQASKSATSLAHEASASAESAAARASSSASSLAAQASTEVARKADTTRDYIYANWSDSELRGYLQKKGIIAKEKSSREQLLDQVKSSYDYVWEAWTDSYMHDWLVAHNLIRSEAQKQRDEYVNMMKNYHYDVNSYVWDSWSDSELRGWLIQHNVVKSDAELRREKMLKLVRDTYSTSLDTVYAGWSDSQLKQWLVSSGYLKSDAQKKREELVALIHEKYSNVAGALNGKAEEYLTWPDARLRAYLREHDYDEEKVLPASRPGLLQEVRIKWVQGTNKAGGAYAKLREIVCSGVEFAEEKIGAALSILTGTAHDAAKHGKKSAAELVKEYEVLLSKAEKEYSVASADLAKASKKAEAKVIREKEAKFAEAKARVSSVSAELAKESKRAKAEL